MKPKRDLLLDIYRGIAIFLVLLGHGKLFTGFYNFIYSFHVGLFFIGKGFFIDHEVNKYSIAAYIRSTVSKLALPYVLVLTINLLLKIVKKIIKSQPLELHQELRNFSQVLIFPHHTNLEQYEYYMYVWFVPLFIFTSLALFILMKYFRPYFKLVYGMLFVLMLFDYLQIFKLSTMLWWSELDKLPLTLFLSMTGVWIIHQKERLLDMSNWLTFVAAILLFTSAWFQFDMRSNIYPHLSLFVMYMIVGCICTLKFSQLVITTFPPLVTQVMTFSGKSSLIIYIAHAPIYYTLVSFLKVIPSPFFGALLFNSVAITLSLSIPVVLQFFKRFILLR